MVRAAATAAGGLVDRISVRDYIREVEIGAFRAERGVTQRVRFNVVLEVAHSVAATTDDVDQVLSYETITEAIEAALAAERLNLLETLAERVAAGCLADPRAARVFVRIEKLDRIPGALGVEIARARVPGDAARLRPVAPQARPETPRRAAVGGAPRRRACSRDPRPTPGSTPSPPRRAPPCSALAPSRPQPPARAEGALRAGLLAIEAAAWLLADRDPRLTVAATRAELDWALKSGRRPVWAPAKMLTDALPRPALDASDPAALAAWLAAEIGADTLVARRRRRSAGSPDGARASASPRARPISSADGMAGVPPVCDFGAPAPDVRAGRHRGPALAARRPGRPDAACC